MGEEEVVVMGILEEEVEVATLRAHHISTKELHLSGKLMKYKIKLELVLLIMVYKIYPINLCMI